MSSPSRARMWLAFAAIYLIWGSTYLGIRVAIESIPPFLMAAVRFLIAGPILLAFVRWQGVPWPSWKQVGDHAVVGVLLLVGGNGLVAWSEQYIPSGIAALLIGIGPLFTVLAEWAWPGGQRPTLATFAGLGLGLAGVAWLAAPWEQASGQALHAGAVVAILVACASWAVGSIHGRHARPATPPFMAAAIQMLAGGLALLLLALVTGEATQRSSATVTGRSLLALAYLIVFGSLVAFTTFVWLMKHSTPARVATYAYVNPMVAVLLGWLLLDEPISPRTLTAAGVIVTVVVITLQKSRPPAPTAPAPNRCR